MQEFTSRYKYRQAKRGEIKLHATEIVAMLITLWVLGVIYLV